MEKTEQAAVLVRMAGLVVTASIGVLVVFQVLLAAGVPWGRAAYGGQSADLPANLRTTSAIAAVVWSLLGLVVLRRAGLIGWSPLPEGWIRPAAWVLVALFAVATVLNAITPSALERAIWFPVSALMLAGTLVIVLRG
ncbi:MAG: hypothetical protein ACOH16_02425 [Propionibacteriaceae bacterium]